MIGLAGYGRWGHQIHRVLTELGEHVQIYDPAIPHVGSYAGLVDRADRIVIAAPPQHHFNLAWKAVAESKPVYIEKPLTLDYAEARVLWAYARTVGVQVAVGHVLTHAVGYRQATVIPPKRIRAYRAGSNPGYHNVPAWWDLGVHDVAAAVRIHGRPETVRVEQDFETYRAELEWDGAEALLVGNRDATEKRWDIEYDDHPYSPYGETVEPLKLQLQSFLNGGDNLDEGLLVVETLDRGTR